MLKVFYAFAVYAHHHRDAVVRLSHAKMMITTQCDNVMLIADLNKNTVREAFNTLLFTHDLQNYVD